MTTPADITTAAASLPLAAAGRRIIPRCAAADCDVPMNLRLSVETGLCCCHRPKAHDTDPTCKRCHDLLTVDDPDGDYCAWCTEVLA